MRVNECKNSLPLCAEHAKRCHYQMSQRESIQAIQDIHMLRLIRIPHFYLSLEKVQRKMRFCLTDF